MATARLRDPEPPPRRIRARVSLQALSAAPPVAPGAAETSIVQRAVSASSAPVVRAALREAACAIAASPDGRLVATGDRDGVLRIRDARTGRLLRETEAHVIRVRCLAWSADGELLASAGGRKIRIWNVATGAAPVVIVAGYPKSIAFGPDGWLYDGNCGKWDPVTGRSLVPVQEGVETVEVFCDDHSEPDLDTPFEGPSNGAAIGLGEARAERDATLSPDRVWAVMGGRLVAAASVDRDRCRDFLERAVLAPNRSWVLTVRSDGVMTIWNATTGFEIGTLAKRGRLVAISADSRWICSGPLDYGEHTVRVWDSWTGAPRDVIELPAAPTCMAATGSEIWVGCDDYRIRRVPLPR
jgi:WD40 repeat protein